MIQDGEVWCFSLALKTYLVYALGFLALFAWVDVVQDPPLLAWNNDILVTVLALLGRAIHSTDTADDVGD